MKRNTKIILSFGGLVILAFIAYCAYFDAVKAADFKANILGAAVAADKATTNRLSTIIDDVVLNTEFTNLYQFSESIKNKIQFQLRLIKFNGEVAISSNFSQSNTNLIGLNVWIAYGDGLGVMRGFKYIGGLKV